jgi:hypothetical protein
MANSGNPEKRKRIPKTNQTRSAIKQTAVRNMKHGSTRAAQRPNGPAWTSTDERLERESQPRRRSPGPTTNEDIASIAKSIRSPKKKKAYAKEKKGLTGQPPAL